MSKAPWTEEQVACLNAYQAHGRYHPFTCPNRSEEGHQERHGDLGVLVATTDGWVCPDCDYTQDWAHDSMVTYKPVDHPYPWEYVPK